MAVRDCGCALRAPLARNSSGTFRDLAPLIPSMRCPWNFDDLGISISSQALRSGYDERMIRIGARNRLAENHRTQLEVTCSGISEDRRSRRLSNSRSDVTEQIRLRPRSARYPRTLEMHSNEVLLPAYLPRSPLVVASTPSISLPVTFALAILRNSSLSLFPHKVEIRETGEG